MTETGVVATYAGMAFPSVTIFMDGFARGVEYYNEAKGTDVKVLGWDTATQTGIAIDTFGDTDKGKQIAAQLMDQDADVIFPVAGGAGAGTLAEMKDRGTGLFIGVDADMTLTMPDYKDMILTSVMKNMDKTTLEVIQSVLDGTFAGGMIIGDLDNGGVGLAPLYGFESIVPAELQAELAELMAKIIAGEIELNPDYALK